MNPRLKVLPLTGEDTAIWCRVYLRAGCWPAFGVGPASAADRRDADLMLLAQQVSSCGPCAVELHGIACRGWSQGVLSPERFAQAWAGALDL